MKAPFFLVTIVAVVALSCGPWRCNANGDQEQISSIPKCEPAAKHTNLCNFIHSTTHYHIVVSNESEAILQSVGELIQSKSNKCNQFIGFAICFYLFRNCELRNTSDPSSGLQLSICQNKCSSVLKIADECIDDSDFQTLLENSNYNEAVREIVAWAMNFNCYNPTTYAVPEVPISNTSCHSLIDGLLPSTSAGSEESFNTAAAVAISATVVIVLLAVMIILGILIYFCYKKKKVKNTIMTRDLNVQNNQYSFVQPKESPLLQQLRVDLKDKRMIVSKDQIHLSSVVGHGESGLVYKGYIDTAVGSELVAVKTGKALFSSGDLERLTKEISTMLSFEHPNVMSLVGVCLDGEMPLLIMPFMSNGSVLEYIRDHKQELLLTSEATDEEVQAARTKYLNMCHQITKGMTYLAKQKFVHRDLAARNCMIDGCGVIKVADFGLTEDMYCTNFFHQDKSVAESKEKVPIKWMAPESIENDIYNESTDVWAFGVTVWELFTCGRVPFSGIPVTSVLKELKAGHRLEKPENTACYDEIYDLMMSCWNLDSLQRPKFANLQFDVSELLEAAASYMKLICPLKEQVLDDNSTSVVITPVMTTVDLSTKDKPT